MRRLFVILIWVLFLTGFYFFYSHNNFFDFKNNLLSGSEVALSEGGIDAGNISPLTGEPCDNFSRRPFVVMIDGNPQMRPISGISQADLVIEMPASGANSAHLAAFFICEEPEEIGNIASAWNDFVPLIKSFDAIFIHRGNLSFSSGILNEAAIDDVSDFNNTRDVFYKKNNIEVEDNNFTSYGKLFDAVNSLNYRQNSKFEGYSHLKFDEISAEGRERSELILNYLEAYKIKYLYDNRLNEYFRYRGNSPEVDKNNNFQVKTKNVVVMFINLRQDEEQYNNIYFEREGAAVVFRNGEKIKAIWKKDKNNLASKLYFLDEDGDEIKFVPGKIWIEIVDPTIAISWSKI